MTEEEASGDKTSEALHGDLPSRKPGCATAHPANGPSRL